MLILRDQRKTHQEIAQITGYTHTYVSTMLKRLAARPQLLQDSLRAVTAKGERLVQQLICGKFSDQLSLPFALWTAIGHSRADRA